MSRDERPRTRREAPALAWPLALACALPFLHVLAGGALYFRDIVHYHRPVRVLIRDLWSRGILPVWDPLRDGGRFLLANPNHRILHPTALLDALLPVDTAIAVSAVAQVFIAGLGMALLLRELGLSRAASRLGGLAYALSGPMLSLVSLPNLLGGAAWVPIAIWAGLICWRRPRWLLAAALLAAVPILSGAVEAWGVVAVSLVGLSLLLPGGPRLRRVCRSALTLAGSIALGAIQILPTWHALRASSRGLGFPEDFLLRWSASPWRILEGVVPLPWGVPTDADSWGGATLFDKGLPLLLSCYLGAGVVALALAGLVSLRPRRRDVTPDAADSARAAAWVLLPLAGAILLLAAGDHGPLTPALVATLPAADLLRFPERLLPLALPALSLLVALGWRGVETRAEQARARLGGGASLAVAAVALAVVTGSAAVALGLTPAGPGGPLAGHALRHLLFPLLSLTVLAAAVGAVVPRFGPAPAAWLVVAAVALDLGAVLAPINPTVGRDALTERVLPRAIERDASSAAFTARAPRVLRDPALDGWAAARWPGQDAAISRRGLAGATPLEAGVGTALTRDIDRFDPLGCAYLRAMHARRGPGPGREALADRAAASWSVEAPGPSRSTAAVARRRPGSAPLVSLVPEVIALPALGERGALEQLDAALADPRWAPAERVYVVGDGARDVLGTWEPESDGARILALEPGRIVVEVEAPGPGALVLRQALVPGWSASVDGLEATVLRADLAWQAVIVDAGAQRIEFRYRQPGLFEGLLIAVGALACLGYAASVARPIDDRPDDP